MIGKRLFIITVYVIAAYPAVADITPNNYFDYLESGEANYNIAVSIGGIKWDENRDDIGVDVRELEKRLADRPDDIDSLIELIALYNRLDRGDEATVLARDNLTLFENDYVAKGNETSAVAYAKAVTAANNDVLYDEAYLALLPFLESGEANKDTFETAITLRTAAMDYELAVRIADAYITVYPGEASEHYQKFSAISTRNVYNIIGYWLQSSAEIFLEGRGETSINESNVEPFIRSYIQKISGAFEIPSIIEEYRFLIEKAVELDPDNYEYNLAAAIFKTLIVYYSAIGSVGVAEDLDESSLVDLFRSSDPEGIANILPYLNRAETVRPKTDVQVYLAYALYYMSFGEFDSARKYARLAVDTRPDLPEAYDALIVITVLPIAVELQDDPGKMAEVFPELLNEKILNTGGDAYDFAVLAAVEFFRYPGAEPEGRQERLAQMKEYIDKSLEKDMNNPTALLNLGNFYILKGNYNKAIDVLTSAYKNAEQDKKPIFLNNRGIARVLNDDREGGIADLESALALSDGNERTTEALAALANE